MRLKHCVARAQRLGGGMKMLGINLHHYLERQKLVWLSKYVTTSTDICDKVAEVHRNVRR